MYQFGFVMHVCMYAHICDGSALDSRHTRRVSHSPTVQTQLLGDVAAKVGKSSNAARSDEECSSEGKDALELRRIGTSRLQSRDGAGAATCFREALKALEEDRSTPSWVQQKGEISMLFGDALDAAGDSKEAAVQYRKVVIHTLT
jgi:hypothetical protein